MARSRNIRSLIVGVILVLTSTAVIYTHITRQKVATVSDLKVVRGPFQDSAFGARGHYCDIKLEADNNTYRIPSDFFRGFDEQSFKSTVYNGDPLTMLINNKAVVFSVSDKSKSFLNADSTIPIYNGYLDVWKGMLLFLVGSGLVSWGFVGYRNMT